MHLIFNELSFQPIATNSHVAEEKFNNLLNTFKVAKEKYDFNHIRFPQNYESLYITDTQTFKPWIYSMSNKTIMNLILGLCKKPFMDDLEQNELNIFFESNYVINDDEVPTSDPPIGLPVAFIKSLPAISIDSHSFWRKRKIFINKTNDNDNDNDNIGFFSYNICKHNDINSAELGEWANTCMSIFIDSQEMLSNYLSFDTYSPSFTDNFMEQFFDWKANDTDQYKYLLLLMKDVEKNPFTGGMGQTKNLRYKRKEASKHITQLNRLSYTLENNIVTFIACKGHYDFH